MAKTGSGSGSSYHPGDSDRTSCTDHFKIENFVVHHNANRSKFKNYFSADEKEEFWRVSMLSRQASVT